MQFVTFALRHKRGGMPYMMHSGVPCFAFERIFENWRIKRLKRFIPGAKFLTHQNQLKTAE
jgi:hypothetical protein